MQFREMAFEHLHCRDNAFPSGPPLAYPCQACGPPPSSGGDSDPTQDIWHPYWVRCKFHGWQQCPTCTAEIATPQCPTNNRCDTQPPSKRSRYSLHDDFQIGQIEAFLSSLSMDQMSVAASVLMEQYIRNSAMIAIPHAEDLAGFQAILSLMKCMTVRPCDDPSSIQTSRDDRQPTPVTMVNPSQSYCNASAAAIPPSYSCNYVGFDHCHFFQFIREVPTADADVDVS